MVTRKFSITLLVAIGLVAVAAAPHYRRTRPNLRCAIPDRDYQYKEFSPTRRSLSEIAVGLRQPVPLINGRSQERAIQSFQFVKNPVLQLDHCFLSEMSVLLHESGHWTVSFRAYQNPLEGIEPLRDVTTAEEPVLITSHILRNEFHVRVTCYGRYGTDAETKLGKPVVIPLKLDPFWVQRGVPYPFFATGYHERIHDNFDLVDRVEIEFFYRVE